MTWYRVGPAGIPGSLKTDMDAVLNKKFGTSTTYPPNTWPDNVNLLGPLPEKTASGAIAHIEDGADEVPLKNWLVTLPASLDGYTEVNGVQSGKNLLDKSTVSGANILWYYYDDGIKLCKGVTYTFSCDYTGIGTGNGSVSFYALDHTTQIAISYGENTPKVTYTPTEDVVVCPRIYKNGLTSSDDIKPMLEVGSTATSYEAYSAPTQYTASLESTIYGGTADIVTGEGEDENGNAFTFTPIQAATELGVNNFWADEGDSDVTYRADISLALQALGGGGRGLMGMMQPLQIEQLTREEDPEEVPEETETDER